MSGATSYNTPQNRMSKRTIERIVKKTADKAGISKTVSPHALRRTFAANCIKKGISTRAAQSLLGD
jgi:integrase/recombinase XerD